MRARRVRDGQLVTNGGRILNVTALGDSIAAARAAAYDAASHIDFAGVRFRRDIAMSDVVVGILVGSESDRERMQGAFDVLDEEGVGYEFDVRSAHRTPGRGRRVRADARASAACAC